MGYNLPFSRVFGAVANIEHARGSRHEGFIIVTRHFSLALRDPNPGRKHDLLLEEAVSVAVNNVQCLFIGDGHMVEANTDDLAVFSVRRVDCGIFLATFGA